MTDGDARKFRKICETQVDGKERHSTVEVSGDPGALAEASDVLQRFLGLQIGSILSRLNRGSKPVWPVYRLSFFVA
jgi:hypothetical protein